MNLLMQQLGSDERTQGLDAIDALAAPIIIAQVESASFGEGSHSFQASPTTRIDLIQSARVSPCVDYVNDISPSEVFSTAFVVTKFC